MKDLGLLILRLSFGGMMLTHGIPKLQKLIEGGDIKFPDPIGIGPVFSLVLAIFAELVCAILVMAGFKVRWASIPLIVTMAVAAFIVHGDDPWRKQEFALLYLAGFVVIFLLNSGKYSVDALLPNKKKRYR